MFKPNIIEKQAIGTFVGGFLRQVVIYRIGLIMHGLQSLHVLCIVHLDHGETIDGLIRCSRSEASC